MKTKSSNLLWIAAFQLMWLPAHAQAEAQESHVDTTSSAYQLGYQIGSWLPFILLIILAMMVIIRSYRLSADKQHLID